MEVKSEREGGGTAQLGIVRVHLLQLVHPSQDVRGELVHVAAAHVQHAQVDEPFQALDGVQPAVGKVEDAQAGQGARQGQAQSPQLCPGQVQHSQGEQLVLGVTLLSLPLWVRFHLLCFSAPVPALPRWGLILPPIHPLTHLLPVRTLTHLLPRQVPQPRLPLRVLLHPLPALAQPPPPQAPLPRRAPHHHLPQRVPRHHQAA